MKKEFVPYDQALELKKLGFNDECFAGYDIYTKELYIGYENSQRTFNIEYYILAPILAQTFRWFREKYNLIPDIQYYGNWNFEIFRIGEFAEPMDDVNVDYTFKGGTYEESELECLKKLIEIVKSK